MPAATCYVEAGGAPVFAAGAAVLLADSDLTSLLGAAVPSPFASPLPPPSLPAPVSDFDAASVFAGAGLAPLPLKSVAYQPLPLSLNPAAERSLTSVAAWQDGQLA